MTAAPQPGASPVAQDPADALMRQELARPEARPGARYLPGDHDPLRDGLELGHADAPRQRRLAAFRADPAGHLVAWRLVALLRALGADATLLPDGRVQPAGFGCLPPFLRAEARGRRGALSRWLAIERDTPAALRQHARPPYGAEEALRERADFCACCGPPPPGVVSLWSSVPPDCDWRCDTCCPPPDDDDRVAYGYGRSGPDPAPAGRAPGGAGPAPRAEEGTPT
jgi:hypothetical protein